MFRPTRSSQVELLDQPISDTAELAANLADLRVANRWLGGTASVLRGMELALRGSSHGELLRVLDVATGSGDLPLALAAWGRRRKIPLQVYGSDLLAEVLALARRHTAGALPLLRHDALLLPVADRGVDVVTCAQALHHFEPAQAIALLGELCRAARQAVVVGDLSRTWPAYLGARALAFTQRSPISRHDGPLSALRAYTPAEVRQLCAAAGMPTATVIPDGLFRLVAVWRRDRKQ